MDTEIDLLRQADKEVIKEYKLNLNAWVKEIFNDELKQNTELFIIQFFKARNEYLSQLEKSIAFYEIIVKNNKDEFPILLTPKKKTEIITVLDQIYPILKFDIKLETFKVQFRDFKLSKHKYYLFKELIVKVNDNLIDPKSKLPDFKDFEMVFLKYTMDENKRYKSLVEEYGITIKNLQQDLRNEFEKTMQLDKDILDLERTIYKKDNKIQEIEEELQINNNYTSQLKNYLPLLESSNVTQFDNTIWGDNYPALKVFFNFLIDRRITYLNWSVFANYMNVDNQTPIDFNFKDFSKNDLGFLFYILKEFFIYDLRKNVTVYSKFLNFKFRIDGKIFKMSEIKKHVRNYGVKLEDIGKSSQDTSELKNQKMIEDLYLNIKKRYFKL